MVYIPKATYRLQVSPAFTLKDVRKIIPYLHELGISTLYAAPFFKAKTGSEHGYDVAEVEQIGHKVGTTEEFEEITRELQERGMGWLQDIVPNHMAYHPENRWLMDVLEKGQKSYYINFFDIDFAHPGFGGKLMVPFLGDTLKNVLKERQLKLTFGESGFSVNYFETCYPASLSVYEPLILQILEEAGTTAGTEELRHKLEHLQQTSNSDKIDMALWQQVLLDLSHTIQQNEALNQALEKVLAGVNNHPESFQQVLEQQYYTLCHWQLTEQQINFRRFFTVNDLICLRMEQKEVFDKYHEFIKRLVDTGLVQGLRVDHVDGLFDPDTYLERLRQMAGEEVYLVVEKILEGHENLPEDWPIQGNSGYDFLAWISNLFTDPTGEKKLTSLYKQLVPDAATDYEKLVFEKKMFILKNQMPGELENLLRYLGQHQLLTPEFTEEQWRKALGVLLASFPVYRIYARSFPLSELAVEVIDKAFAEALHRAPDIEAQLLHLRSLFQPGEQEPQEVLQHKLYFVMRSQQFTGPLAAKGVEDTTFYNYNRFISLNEVGNSPDVFNIRPNEFHKLMKYKLKSYPHSLNATATHDTKRGEGARMRLNVLSELPDEWEVQVQDWLAMIQEHIKPGYPKRNDIYFLLQTLLGVLPVDGAIDESIVERVQEYLIKAFREAKVNTNWSEPNEEYESAVKELVEHLLLKDEKFMQAFRPFFLKLAHYGWIYSLCQALLKVTCPGVPDIYQGCELWDFSLVDPDNRRPVDYEQRQHYLQEMKVQEQQDADGLLADLLANPADARVKLYLLYKVLNVRRDLHELFSFGDYQPLNVTGKHKTHILAFTRRYEGQWCMVVVPRLLVPVVSEEQLPLGQVWEDTTIVLPPDAPAEWQQIFGQQQLTVQPEIPVADILDKFPVAFLTATAS
ncbi:malto-oligosyltrehalose synthase [Pontibacter qinzhouensis]|uniref:Malto-oligosyltrehalose synthase n=1 Tax=Pontibacter qinzhouensis TaxID=2603253 RepID=A0A5C8IKS4_9BACT|nr:malto-oligosyltrehalose synthase [Pontibacter qinzhouensis]TXK21565.1 malto-oligosyltrehalose synthase [Pontibacter qinzhouensis]